MVEPAVCSLGLKRSKSGFLAKNMTIITPMLQMNTVDAIKNWVIASWSWLQFFWIRVNIRMIGMTIPLFKKFITYWGPFSRVLPNMWFSSQMSQYSISVSVGSKSGRYVGSSIRISLTSPDGSGAVSKCSRGSSSCESYSSLLVSNLFS